MSDLLLRVTNLRRHEIVPTILAIGYFFFILFGYFLIRPVRESLGVERGVDELHWLFIGTAFFTLLVIPLYGLLASRLRRTTLYVLVYGFALSNLLGFYALRTFAPDAIGVMSGRAFYVWLSVFNLFAVSMFWQLMADCFTLEQSKRIFPMVAVGGTLGAICGLSFAWQLAETIGSETLMLIAGAVILIGVLCALTLMNLVPSVSVAGEKPPNTFLAAIRGVSLVSRSPYLLGICGYIFMVAIVATLLYFAQAEVVTTAADETDERTTLFARIELFAQIGTLVLQLTVVGRLMRRVGVGVMLIVLPVVGMAMLGSVALMPTVLMLTIAQALYRAGTHAVARPARETLFTVLTREEKFEAKAVLDTFVYRTGDVVGAWAKALVEVMGAGLSVAAVALVPIGLGWAVLGLVLGRAQARLAPGARNVTGAGEPQEPS